MSVAALIALYRAATPSERCDIHAGFVRQYGAGFANVFRDLVESDELIRDNERKIAQIPRRRA